MGLVDWNNNGVEPHEIARAGMIASHWMDESSGGSDEHGDDGGSGCGCLLAIVAVIVLLPLIVGALDIAFR